MSEWISVDERMPPAVTKVLAYGRQWGAGNLSRRTVFQTFINTRPRECVEDEEITHWMPLPAPPALQESRDV